MAQDDRLGARYLELLKKSLLDELYLENEARLIYVVECMLRGQSVDAELLTRPQKLQIFADLQRMRTIGGYYMLQDRAPDGSTVPRPEYRFVTENAHTMMGRKRLDNLHECLDAIVADGVPGDLIETGVWRGGGTIFMRGFLAAHDVTDRRVWVADSFEGLPKPTLAEDAQSNLSKEVAPFLAISLDEVKALFERYGLLDDQVQFLKGWFRDTLPGAPIERLALLRLDGDLYESTMDALVPLYDKLSPGGFVIVDDYGALPQCKLAIDEFRADRDIIDRLYPIDGAAIFWRKGG
ncbi:MAG: TylF/MycF family methyltransferase [Alphaproteobacteria bacterium]|nr:TylF/MycF family methyltransferase [Alphaproteobacteria bacterium]